MKADSRPLAAASSCRRAESPRRPRRLRPIRRSAAHAAAHRTSQGFPAGSRCNPGAGCASCRSRCPASPDAPRSPVRDGAWSRRPSRVAGRSPWWVRSARRVPAGSPAAPRRSPARSWRPVPTTPARVAGARPRAVPGPRRAGSRHCPAAGAASAGRSARPVPAGPASSTPGPAGTARRRLPGAAPGVRAGSLRQRPVAAPAPVARPWRYPPKPWCRVSPGQAAAARASSAPPQQATNACQQFLRLEGFGHVVVGSQFQRADDIHLACLGGQHQHRHAFPAGLCP